MKDKLIAELREWWDKRPGTGLGFSAMLEWGTELQKILSRHEADTLIKHDDGIIVVNKMEDGRYYVHIGEFHIFSAKNSDDAVFQARQWRGDFVESNKRKIQDLGAK